jgi:hypothetical protein
VRKYRSRCTSDSFCCLCLSDFFFAIKFESVINIRSVLFSQRDYFRQDQNEVLSTTIEIARTLPDDVLRLAGYIKSLPVSFIECPCPVFTGFSKQTKLSVASGMYKTTNIQSILWIYLVKLHYNFHHLRIDVWF